MGGAQMYAANKLAYYEQLGWHPDIFFYNEGSVKIGYLQQFCDNLIPELSKPFIDLDNPTRDRIAQKIIGKYDKNDEVIFECHTPGLSFLGEYLAKKINGKNTVFLLEESYPLFTERELDFFEYKYKRHELLNTFPEVLALIFQERYSPERFNDSGIRLNPYCDNVIDYSPIDLPESVADADYTILSIGRLDKPYVKIALKEILNFTQKYSDKKFNLVIIGGDAENVMEDYINRLFQNCKNVSLYLLGYLFPIPYDWIKVADASIASANSVLVSANEGVPTIAIDTQDLQPIGVYGHTTSNHWIRADEPAIPTSSLLEDIIIDRKYGNRAETNQQSNELEYHLRPHYDYLLTSDTTRSYFDTSKMYSHKDRLIYVCKKALIKFYLGIKQLRSFKLKHKD